MTGLPIVILDESAVMRDRLRTLLEASPAFQLCGVTSKVLALEERARAKAGRVLVLSSTSPCLEDWAVLDRLRKGLGATVVLTCGCEDDRTSLTIRSRPYGVSAVLCKPTDEPTGAAFLRALEGAIPDDLSGALAGSPAQPPEAPSLLRTVREEPAARASTASSYQASLVANGASTGGVEATETVLQEFPDDVPPTLVVQHIRGHFADAHAERLDRVSRCDVAIASHGDEVRAGRVLVAPADRHLTVVRRSGRLVVQLDDGPPVNYHRPSVDRLFQSVAQLGSRRSGGVLLTGMGNDGAAGLLEMREAGMRTIAQDEATSAVYGMPKAAMELGAVQDSLPLDLIAGRLLWGRTQPEENRTWE